MPISTALLRKTTQPIHLSRHLLVAAFALMLAACGSQGQRLNSEQIERTFGSYGVDVIQSSNEVRLSSLYSGSGEDKVTRTFAVVKFSGRVRPAFANEHAQVASGQSLGAVFKAAGWEIEKHNIFIGGLEVPAKYGLLSELMQIGLPEVLATHVYLFAIRKNQRTYNYATIVELHHPDYLSVEDLRSLYGEIIFDDSNRTGIDDFVDPELWKN
jgi:hypothetical protein